MDYIIKQRLVNIETMARTQQEIAQQILRDIQGIYGYCVGLEIVATDYPTIKTLQLDTKNDWDQPVIFQPKTIFNIIEEVKKMIIELKIKASVREHRDGLLKVTTAFGCFYGRSKEEIENKLKERLKQLKGKPQKDKKTKVVVPLLSEFYRKEYLPYKVGDGIAENTIDSYENNIRFIIKQKFDKPLNWYNSKEIEKFLYSFPQTRKRQIMQGFLNNVFNRAITAAYIKNNPCGTIEKVKHKQEQGTSFSFVELKEFLQTLFDIQSLSYNDKCYFLFVFLTGTRRNEARVITVDNIDFENKILHINGTKTDGSNRDIPLTPLVEKLLLSLKVKNGKYFNVLQSNTNKYFREIWSKEKGHKLHDLRHTFGTIQICVNKIDVKTVSLLMGHSTVDTTLRIYTHPEQLDKGTFLNGGLSDNEKLNIYRQKYDKIIKIIKCFIR